MKSLQYFQPMVHVPLTKIDSVAYLVKPMKDYLVYPKPIGIDIYVANGKIFDFYHKELLNRMLLFNFEKLLTLSRQMQGMFLGTLCTITDPQKIFKHAPLLYADEALLPISVRFMAYDVIFPYFKVDNPFWVRNDVAKKTLNNVIQCSCLDLLEFETIGSFKAYVKDRFNISRHTSLLVFDKEGSYYVSNRQLSYSPYDQVSFELSASQKYRSHIKKIKPIEVVLEEGRTATIADSIEARFKNKTIVVPITSANYILRKSLWEHRKELKRTPFIFEGLYFEENGDFEILGMHYSKFLL